MRRSRPAPIVDSPDHPTQDEGLPNAPWIEFAPGMISEFYDQVNHHVNRPDNRPPEADLQRRGPLTGGWLA